MAVEDYLGLQLDFTDGVPRPGAADDGKVVVADGTSWGYRYGSRVTYLSATATASDIDAALAAADAAGGGVVELPAGTYQVTIDFTGLTGVTVRGQGFGVTTLQAVADETVVLFDGSTRCGIERLTVDGDQSSFETHLADAVHLTNSDDCVIELEIIRQGAWALYAENGADVSDNLSVPLLVVDGGASPSAGSKGAYLGAYQGRAGEVRVSNCVGNGVEVGSTYRIDSVLASGCAIGVVLGYRSAIGTIISRDNTSHGIHMPSTLARIGSALTFTNGGYGLRVTGSLNVVAGVVSSGDASDMIVAPGNIVLNPLQSSLFGGCSMGDQISAETALPHGDPAMALVQATAADVVADARIRTLDIQITTWETADEGGTKRQDTFSVKLLRDGANYTLWDPNDVQDGPGATPAIGGTLSTGLTWSVLVYAGSLDVSITPDASTDYTGQVSVFWGAER